MTPASHSPYTVDGYRLGSWVTSQRANARKGILDAIGSNGSRICPGWTWDPRADRWEEGFSRLTEYVERHGNARVPQSYKVDGYPLGAWVRHATRQTTETAFLTPIANADSRSCRGWTWESRTDQWEEGFSQLRRYAEIDGDARVPRSYKIDGHTLGQWVVTQRQKRAKGTLEPIANADSKTFPAGHGMPPVTGGSRGSRRLLDYVEQPQSRLVPVSYTVDDYPLGRLGLKAAHDVHQRQP